MIYKEYKTEAVYSKPMTPNITAGTEANINEVYAIHHVSLNVYFTCQFSSYNMYINQQDAQHSCD